MESELQLRPGPHGRKDGGHEDDGHEDNGHEVDPPSPGLPLRILSTSYSRSP